MIENFFEHWHIVENLELKIPNSLVYDSNEKEDEFFQVTEFDECFVFEYFHKLERVEFLLIPKIGDFTSKIKDLCDIQMYNKYLS